MGKKTGFIPSKVLIPLIFLAAVLALLVVNAVSARIFQSFEVDKGQTKLALYQAVIENELSRLQHLPRLLAQDTDLSNLPVLNEKLKSISNSSKAEAIYVLDQQGQTIAASNFDQETTFLGQNYQFRPYFLDAMQGLESAFFAIGATTSRPGYFLSAPILHNTNPIGALVVKIDLTALNSALEATQDQVLVTNDDGVVVLSSSPELRYRATRQIHSDRMIEIRNERQFGREALHPIEWATDQSTITVDEQTYLLLQTPLAGQNWNMNYLADTSFAKTRALAVTAVLAALMIGASTVFLVWKGQRVRHALVNSQQDRRRLQREIKVRRAAESNLEQAQTALRRSSKLAALGQLSASVTHELGQPISAMKNHLAAEMMVSPNPTGVLGSLSGIVERMENITKQLKFFATSGDDFEDRVDLWDVVAKAVDLMDHDFKKDEVDIAMTGPEGTFDVNGNGQRLEQVIINILRNSLKALQGTDERHIEIKASSSAKNHILTFRDNGHGLKGQTFDQIAEPFHTTGPSGEGMGLGLAISRSIIEEHDGTMSTRDIKTGGVEFKIKLPKVTG